jgi:thiol-disulfide isomerase/thioredoxin
MKLKTYFFAILLLCASFFAAAQTVQKIKMAELAAYIAHSDSVLVVNFWATYCKPCVEEIPYLIKICKKYKGQKVKLLLISLDMPADYPVALKAFIKKHRFIVQNCWLAENDADYFCPQIDKKWSGAIPATLIVNKAKNYREFFEQPFKEAAFEALLKTALGM